MSTHPIRRTLAAVGLAMLTLGAPALAEDEHPIDQALSACLETPEGMSTHGMRACLDTANAEWDRELNRIWKDLMRELPAEAQTALRASQRQWLSFRDAEIAALEAAYGQMDGTMYLVMLADAVVTLTRDRVRQLDALLEAQRSSAQ